MSGKYSSWGPNGGIPSLLVRGIAHPRFANGELIDPESVLFWIIEAPSWEDAKKEHDRRVESSSLMVFGPDFAINIRFVCTAGWKATASDEKMTVESDFSTGPEEALVSVLAKWADCRSGWQAICNHKWRVAILDKDSKPTGDLYCDTCMRVVTEEERRGE